MDEEQEKYLEEAVSVVKQESFQMQRSLDASNLREAMKHACNMICELRTSLLSPKTYYELYMQVFDQLSRLEAYFMEEYRRGRNMLELYEKVQHAGNILPRLYLLITVGSVYIQTREVASKEILKDLIEMVKGVQHPMRGLFLRYYLNKMCKDKLPDKGNEYEQESSDVTDSIDFLLTNLSEMNRLWVRMQHTGSIRDKTRREKERNDLRVTVGENIVRLSSLEGVTIELYESVVLPKILEVVTSSKDLISQQYLMDCIIQAFPDEYHLHTLKTLLEGCTQLQTGIEIKSILINLLNRLSDYAGEQDIEIVRQIDIFGLIKNYIDSVISEQAGSTETKKLLELQVAFLRLSLKCYPLNTENVNAILDSCVKLIEKGHPEGRLDPESLKCIVKLLSFPLETLSLAILSMNFYPKLMGYLQFNSRKQVASKIVEAVVSSKKLLDSMEVMQQLLEFIEPLLFDSSDGGDSEAYEFEDEQQSVGKLIHLIQSEDLDAYFEMLLLVKNKLQKGGIKRMSFTYPPLVFAFIRFVSALEKSEVETKVTVERVLKLLLECIGKLEMEHPELSLRLNLQCVQCINNFKNFVPYEEIAYEFASQALVIYQDELSESHAKHLAITIITGTFIHLNCFEEDNGDTLVTNCAQYAARQLKKPDQCIGVTLVTHLFWNEYTQNERRVIECLKKAVKIADICVTNPKNIVLFVTILNKYLYFMVNEVPSIEGEAVNSLIELIREHLSNIESDSEAKTSMEECKNYFRNTINYIKNRQAEGKLNEISV